MRGKHNYDIFAKYKAEDHPRGCGENLQCQSVLHAGLGSPPRMRGKLSSYVSKRRYIGITPADAGKTSEFLSGFANDGDHPRGCGENSIFVHLKPLRRRITPADAGKTITTSNVLN